jgi:hypothetical protein
MVPGLDLSVIKNVVASFQPCRPIKFSASVTELNDFTFPSSSFTKVSLKEKSLRSSHIVDVDGDFATKQFIHGRHYAIQLHFLGLYNGRS